MAGQNPLLMAVRPNGMESTPQYQIDIDQAWAGAQNLTMAEVNDTLGTALGGSYVNDFIDKGRVKKVYVQGDAPFRMMPEDIFRWYARNTQGDMVPFSSFAKVRWTYGSPRLERYNGLPAMEIQGMPAPGRSSGDAMRAMEDLVAKLPAGISSEWTGLSYQERLSGAQAPSLYAISMLVVFLCLAALYESWSVPTVVMLMAPLGVFGAALAAYGRGLSNDVYFQVGLLTTIGLSAKNAILIVEFAKRLYERGKALPDASWKRFGSGCAIGTGVLGGMLAATILGVFFVAVFFVLIMRSAATRRSKIGINDDRTATDK